MQRQPFVLPGRKPFKLPARNVVAEKRELRNTAARDLQSIKYPTDAESAERGTKPITEGGGFNFERLPGLGDVWNAGKTFLSDLIAMPLHQIGDSFSRAKRGVETAADPNASFGDRVRGVMDVMPVTAGYNQLKDMSLASSERTASANLPVTSKIVAVLPIVGPMVDSLSEEAGREGAAPAAGHVAAAIVAPKVYGKIGDMAMSPKETLKTAYGAARHPIKTAYTPIKQKAIDTFGPSPTDAHFRAIKPMNSKVNFGKAHGRFQKSTNETAMDHLARASEEHQMPIVDIASEATVNDLAIRDLLAARKPLLGDRVVEVNGRSIADSIVNSVPKLDRLKNPTAFQALKEWAYETYNRKFTTDMLDEFRMDSNASQPVTGYYNKMPHQQVGLGRRAESAAALAENRAIRELEFRSLDEAFGTGTAMRDINEGLRALLTNKELIDRRFNVDMRQAVQNLPQQVSKLLAVGKFGKAAKSLVQGDVMGAGLEALTGVGEVALADFLKEYNSTSGQIASAFRRHTGRPAPVELKPVSRYDRALNPAGQSGNMNTTVQPQTETGAATPGSRSAQFQWQNKEAIPGGESTGRGANPDTRRPATIPMVRNARGQFESILKQEIPGDTSGTVPLNTKDLGLTEPGYEIRRGPRGFFEKVAGTFKKANEKMGEKGAVPLNNKGGRVTIDGDEVDRVIERFGVKMFDDKKSNKDGSYTITEGELKKLQFELKQRHVADLLSGKTKGDKTTLIKNARGEFDEVFSPKKDKWLEALDVWNKNKGEHGTVKITNYATKKLIDGEIGKIVDPKDVRPNRGMFHSLIVDSDGNLVDLGELTHEVALARMYKKKVLATLSDKELEQAMSGKEVPGMQLMKDAIQSLPTELKKNKLARIQYANKNDISVEVHHKPTAEQVTGLRNLFAAKPGAKVSFDLVAGENRGALKNGGTADDFFRGLEKTWPGSTKQAAGLSADEFKGVDQFTKRVLAMKDPVKRWKAMVEYETKNRKLSDALGGGK